MSTPNTPACGPVRIGMLIPSSNTVLEPATQAMVAELGGRASVHFARTRVTRVGLDRGSDEQFDLNTRLAAAELLADLRPGVIAWNGTSASWLGLESDRQLCAAITERTGITATSAMLGFEAAFARLGVRRLGLVTPYTADMQKAIIARLTAAGVEVVAEAHCGLSDNLEIGSIGDEKVRAMCRQVAAARPDALAIVCTNMRGALLAGALEAELDLPVLDSVAVTLWACLATLDVPAASLAAFGRLFAWPGKTATGPETPAAAGRG